MSQSATTAPGCWSVQTHGRNEAAVLLPDGKRVLSGTLSIGLARRIVASVNHFLGRQLEVLECRSEKLSDLELDAPLEEQADARIYWTLQPFANGSAAVLDSAGLRVAAGNADLRDARRLVSSVNRLIHLAPEALWDQEKAADAARLAPLVVTALLGDRASVQLPNGERFEAPIQIAQRIAKSFNLLLEQDLGDLLGAQSAHLS